MSVTLGENIKTRRKQCGLTQEDLAKKCMTTRQRIARIETGLLDIGMDEIKEISKVLNVNPSLLTETSVSTLFRGDSKDSCVEKVNHIIDFFYANKRLNEKTGD